jgi:hypothetical protein
MARSVRFDLIADPSRFSRGMRQAQRETRSFTDHTDRAGRALKTAFAAFSAGAAVAEMRKWVAQARDANRTAQQTNAVIASTRGAANLSAKGFSDLAKRLQDYAAVDDDVIQGGENILATFTKIRAGGPDQIFERASKAAVDMAAALNHGQVSAEGLQSANLVLGKALQDPIAGLTRLQRIGVSFDEQQKQQIKRFVEAGEVAKAQGVILAEVNKEFGGSAAAAVTPAQRLAVAWGNMQEVLGNLLIPAIDKAATVLTDILTVVDHNRKAFGLLFGVLGTGAAVVGTLIVAEKAHRAVVDATRVATEAWAAVQKGLNLLLGQGAVQTAEAATAEEALAASTRDASAAAAAARANWIALGGAVGIGVAALTAANEADKKTTEGQQKLLDVVLASLGPTNALAGRVLGHEQATKKSTEATKDNADALAVLGPQQADLAAKTAATAAQTEALTGKLQGLKQQFDQQKQAVQESIQSYDGLISKSKVTAKQVIVDLRNQVANFRTYSRDVQRLIRAGVNPAAIRELSQKGPQYVHALATGSNRQLQIYKGYWRDRQREIRGSFAESMQRQYETLVKKIKAMQREINSLKGKVVKVTAQASVGAPKGTLLLIEKGLRRAAGGPVRGPGTATSDSVPAMLSAGEFVINARAAKAIGQQRLAQLNAMHFAQGGPVDLAAFRKGIGRYDRDFRGLAMALGRGVLDSLKKGLASVLTAAAIGIPSSAKANRAIVLDVWRNLYGWSSAAQVRATDQLLMHESGYRNTAQNPTSSAFGMFQFLNGTWGSVGGYKTSDPRLQAVFGGRYIQGRYGSPAGAWGFWQGHHWYDQGGWLPPGTSLATNRTGRPEAIVPASRLRGGTVELHFHGPVVGGQRGAEELAALVDTELRKRRRNGVGVS